MLHFLLQTATLCHVEIDGCVDFHEMFQAEAGTRITVLVITNKQDVK